jgi:1-deoxy-D-xylulose-5-phosphate synthase
MPRLLDSIDTPSDLKRLAPEQLPALCGELREEIIATCARTGGHLGSSLGAVELNVALHYAFESPIDRLVWDVGHQAYAHKLLTGRRERFRTLRTEGGLAGFPERHESEHDAFGVGHASTGVSAALGMAEGKRHAGAAGRVVVVVGDGALTGGMAYEALNQTGALGRDLLVVLNDNGMSISPNVGGLSRSLEARGGAGPRAFFEALGLAYEGPVDGHDVLGLLAALRALARRPGPVLLHARTVKGKGYLPAESDAATCGHALSFFEPSTGKPLPKPTPAPAYTDVFADALCGAMERDPRVVAVTAAMLEGTGLVRCQRRFPGRVYDVGIAEQHAVTFAAGLACEGLRPVVALYSTFLQRAYDQVIHDVALQNLPITFALDRAGVVGADGKTHQGAFDLAFLRCVPNLLVMSPSDENELRCMLATALAHDGPAALRFPRRASVGLPEEPAAPLPVGRARWLREPARPAVLVAAAGVAARTALEAATELAREGLEVAVLDARFVKPLDEEVLCRAAASVRRVLTVEEAALAGGFGAACLEAFERRGLLERGLRVKRLGFPDAFVSHGEPGRQLAALGLDVAGVARALRALAGARRRSARAIDPARATG